MGVGVVGVCAAPDFFPFPLFLDDAVDVEGSGDEDDAAESFGGPPADLLLTEFGRVGWTGVDVASG